MRLRPAGRAAIAGLGLVLLAGGLPRPVRAESLYVIDRLLVGVHEDKTRDSAIVKVVPSGTSLEVLARDGDLAQVKTPDGIVGWVDATYLTAEVPAKLMVDDLETWKKTRTEELKAAWGEVESLRNQLAAAKRENPEVAQVNGALKELQRLQDENRDFKHRLAEAETRLAESRSGAVSVTVGAPAVRESLASGLASFLSEWIRTIVAAMFFLGFGVGALMLDWLQRRRHGGFRV